MTKYEVVVCNEGTSDQHTAWYCNGHLHREDGPAIEFKNGNKKWYINDQLHRENGPAIEFPGGFEYRIKGILHRTDGPATSNGFVKEWYIDGKRHRTDGPAVEWANGNKEWWINGVIIRIDLLIESGITEFEFKGKRYYITEKPKEKKYHMFDGIREWKTNGLLHRENGPAVEKPDGSKEYWLKGKQYPEEQYWAIIATNDE
jgi:hypothetical protein